MTRRMGLATLHPDRSVYPAPLACGAGPKGPKDWFHSARECFTIPARVIASCFALISFAAALWVGVQAGNDSLTILTRALVLMGAAWCVGAVVGGIAQRTIEEHLAEYRAAHPILSDADGTGEDDGATAAAEPPSSLEQNLEQNIDGPEAVARAGG